MTPEDHRKICMKGLIIIRRFDKPRPHIKEKTPENPDKWVEHDGNYTSVQVRDNVADYLLATNLYRRPFTNKRRSKAASNSNPARYYRILESNTWRSNTHGV